MARKDWILEGGDSTVHLLIAVLFTGEDDSDMINISNLTGAAHFPAVHVQGRQAAPPGLPESVWDGAHGALDTSPGEL